MDTSGRALGLSVLERVRFKGGHRKMTEERQDEGANPSC